MVRKVLGNPGIWKRETKRETKCSLGRMESMLGNICKIGGQTRDDINLTLTQDISQLVPKGHMFNCGKSSVHMTAKMKMSYGEVLCTYI